MSVKNEGYLPIFVSEFFCYVVHLNVKQGGGIETMMLGYEGTSGYIGRGETVDFKPPFPAFEFDDPIARGQLLYVVRYYQKCWWARLEKRVLYKIVGTPDGNLEWSRPYIPDELRHIKFATSEAEIKKVQKREKNK